LISIFHTDSAISDAVSAAALEFGRINIPRRDIAEKFLAHVRPRNPATIKKAVGEFMQEVLQRAKHHLGYLRSNTTAITIENGKLVVPPRAWTAGVFLDGPRNPGASAAPAPASTTSYSHVLFPCGVDFWLLLLPTFHERLRFAVPLWIWERTFSMYVHIS
jgi:hypothetical protein